jgi:PAS domain S-box-containing protein
VFLAAPSWDGRFFPRIVSQFCFEAATSFALPMADDHNAPSGTRPRHWDWRLRYGGALGATAIALWAWYLWPVMHQDPFIIFLAAVIVSARIFGFGPAVVCTIASGMALDYFILPPRLSFGLSANDGERLLIFVVVSVLTAGLARQRLRAETRADEARGRMAAIVESSTDAIFSATPDGIITSWNRGAENLYGYSAEEAIGRHISLVAPAEKTDEVNRNTARLNLGEPIESFQTERLRKDGTRIAVLLSISPLRSRNGEIIGHSAIARDITTQTRAAESLRRNEKLATAGRLAAVVAHEINNPLEAVTNLLYLARRDPARQAEYLDQAEKEVERVAEFAHQTLGFVRESSSATPVNISEILEQVLHLYLRRLQDKHLQVEKQYGRDAILCGFPSELRQLFSNLIINAMDAMHDGGHLHVRVRRTRHSSGPSPSGVRVTIADDGTGIARADSPRIFEPFFTTKEDFGTGLGLWFSQGIAQKHGGSIRFRSRTAPGRSGTVFSVFLTDVISQPKPQPSNVEEMVQ